MARAFIVQAPSGAEALDAALAEKSDLDHTHVAVDIADTTTTGRALTQAADAATRRHRSP